MNLFERFWNSINEQADSAAPALASEAVFTAVEPPAGGARSEAGRDLSSVFRRSPRRHAPSLLSQPGHGTKPFCLIYTAAGTELPPFHDLFDQYVDKNGFVAETFLRLKPHHSVPYLLFLGEKCFYLYDARIEELLRWGDEFAALEELLVQPLAAGADVARTWNVMPRKPAAQRSEEFARWLDLWKVALGARTNANPAFMQNLLQKVLFLFLFDRRFGFADPCLSLRTNFMDSRPAAPRKPATRPKAGILSAPAAEKSNIRPIESSAEEQKADVSRKAAVRPPKQCVPVPFDGVAWVHEAAEELSQEYGIVFLQWSQAEDAFFALLSGDARVLFSQFVMELFCLSQGKFDSAVQTDAFSDSSSRMKLWKYAVTETLNVRARLYADEVNVYEPIVVDLEESGLGWSVHVVEQVLEFWRERCAEYKRQLTTRRALPVQFDMFQQADLATARIPLPAEALQTALSTSIRVRYDFPAIRATFEYLILLKVTEFCRRWNLPLVSLGYVNDIFVQKERVAEVQEI